MGRSEVTQTEHGSLACFDGKYRFICGNSHWSVSAQPFMDACTATPQRAVGDGTVKDIGPPCGADIEYRVVDYRGEGG